jgi:hypothetical protein
MNPPAAELSTVSHTHRLRFLGGVAAALILVGGFLYFETLRMSFAYLRPEIGGVSRNTIASLFQHDSDHIRHSNGTRVVSNSRATTAHIATCASFSAHGPITCHSSD